jgi:hypothetical protein
MRIARFIATVGAGASLIFATACVTLTLAPGADKVRLTESPSDVVGCTAVGNLKVTRDLNGNVDIATAAIEFRNLTVGLGGNTAFKTLGPLSVPSEGIAYRCP